MTLLLATAFVTFGFLVTLVASLPTNRASREVSPPSSRTISLIQRAGHTNHTSHEVLVNSGCTPVAHPNLPTILELPSDLPSGHTLHEFSTSRCPDSSLVSSRPLTSQPPILNERRPICSFRLGRNTPRRHPVRVTFAYQNNVSDYTVSSKDPCYSICNAGDRSYPLSVRVSEQNGISANNHVNLFSTGTCQDDSLLLDNVTTSRGRDLVTPTLQNSHLVKSFRIVKT